MRPPSNMEAWNQLSDLGFGLARRQRFFIRVLIRPEIHEVVIIYREVNFIFEVYIETDDVIIFIIHQ